MNLDYGYYNTDYDLVNLDYDYDLTPVLLNLEGLDSEYALINLKNTQGTTVNEFEAKKGSSTMFDFKNGDPLANTKIKDMHMKAGAAVDFNGANGKQEMGITNQLGKGALKRTVAASKSKDLNKAGHALDD